MKVLVVGSGGREHCLAWKIKQSPLVKKLYSAPGNAGTLSCGENIPLSPLDIEGLLKFSLRERIDLTVVGPEAPLVEGIYEVFSKEGLKIFAPSKKAARLEGSKIFAKELMERYNIPTADFVYFSSYEAALKYMGKKEFPLVVKADGLAAGKGVKICFDISQARDFLYLLMQEKKFSSAGEKVVIEEYLEGEEASALLVVDGKSFILLPFSQDHKRVFDADRGPNTGGMGAYAPTPLVKEPLREKIIKKIINPLVEALNKEKIIYQGILYIGLLIKDGEPYVLEFNVRLGDPECQVVLPKVKDDWVEIMLKTIEGKLSSTKISFDDNYYLDVVLASGGYPEKYEKGKVISGLGELCSSDKVLIFYAGVKKEGDNFLTDGGRVLNVVGKGKTLKEAKDTAYEAVKKISFEKMHYRRDIGDKGIRYLMRN